MATRYRKGKRTGRKRTGKRKTLRRRGGDAGAASLFTQGVGSFGTSATALAKPFGVDLPN
jgi:hypothetical protein